MKVVISSAILASLCASVSIEAFAPIASHRASLHSSTDSSSSSLSQPSWTPTTPSTASNKVKVKGGTSTSLPMAAYPTLDEWTIATTGGIKGRVSDSPFPELSVGELITTSKIVTNQSSVMEGTIVETASGSRYILGSKKGSIGQKVRAMASSTSTSAPASSFPTIDNWTLTGSGEINGSITNYNGREFKAGEEVTTSPLSNKRNLRDGSVVTTISGSKYQLGEKKALSFARSVSVPEVSIPEVSIPEVSVSIPKFMSPKPAPVEVAAEPTIKKKIPAPFGSVGRGITKGTGRDTPSPVEQTPLLENWSLNSNEKITGIKDGKRITTSEIVTNAAFVEEGFTVVTTDGRKFKLGAPKGRSASSVSTNMESLDDAVAMSMPELDANIIPTLYEWELNDNFQIKGMVKDTKNKNVPDGTSIQTDAIISDGEFIAEGFTVCTESGRMYKLGRSKGSIGVGTVSMPSMDIAGMFGISGNSEEKKARQRAQEEMDNLPILEEWTVTPFGGVSATVWNTAMRQEMRDGEKVTTSKLLTSVEFMVEGDKVMTVNGSEYRLGKRREVREVVVESKVPLASGVWVIAVLLFGILSAEFRYM